MPACCGTEAPDAQCTTSCPFKSKELVKPPRAAPVRLVVRLATALPWDPRDVTERARPVVVASISGPDEEDDDKPGGELRSAPGLWCDDASRWVWPSQAFRFSESIDRPDDLARGRLVLRLYLIGPPSPDAFGEEPVPFAGSMLSIQVRDAYEYMAEIPRAQWSKEQLLEASILDLHIPGWTDSKSLTPKSEGSTRCSSQRNEERSPHLPSRGRLGLYRTDWLTFSFEPLGELTVSFEAYGLASPRHLVRSTMNSQPPAPTPAPMLDRGEPQGLEDRVLVHVKLSEGPERAKLGLALARTLPARVRYVEPGLPVAQAGVVPGDELISVGGFDVRQSALGDIVRMLAASPRPTELIFARAGPRPGSARDGPVAGDASPAKGEESLS